MLKETNIKLVGYEMLEKEVHKSGNSGRVYVPIEWIGKRVKIVLTLTPQKFREYV